MNRRARVRPQESGLVHFFRNIKPTDPVDLYEPDYTFTRLWMGIAPPEEDTPGYACIVGEKHSPMSVWDKGSFVLVDEATSLQPGDFQDLTPEEQAMFGITAMRAQYPTQETLRDAAIALKDLYQPQICWCVPDRAFIAYLRRGEGLTWYDYRTWQLWGKKFPLIKQRRIRAGQIVESIPKDPYTVGIAGDSEETAPEDRKYGVGELNSLFSEKRIELVRYNQYSPEGDAVLAPSLYHERRTQWPAINRALSWVIFQMRNHPMQVIQRNPLKAEYGYTS